MCSFRFECFLVVDVLQVSFCNGTSLLSLSLSLSHWFVKFHFISLSLSLPPFLSLSLFLFSAFMIIYCSTSILVYFIHCLVCMFSVLSRAVRVEECNQSSSIRLAKMGRNEQVSECTRGVCVREMTCQ